MVAWTSKDSAGFGETWLGGWLGKKREELRDSCHANGVITAIPRGG